MSLKEPDSLELQIGILNPASSQQLMDHLKTADSHQEFYTHLADAKDDVSKVKDMLENTKPEEVTVELAANTDKLLKRLGVRYPEDVQGVEALGLTLMPKDYLLTRVTACEGFLARASEWSKKTIQDFFTMVGDKLVLVKEGHQSLLKRANMVEGKAKAFNQLAGLKTIEVTRYAHLLHKDGDIPVELDRELKRVYMTVKSLLTNYYRVNQSNTNEILSFFGHFNGLEEPEAVARLLQLPKAISRYEFKDAMIAVKNIDKPESVTKSTVTMLGGIRFLNSVLVVRNELKDLSHVHDWVASFKDKECVAFQRLPFESNGEYLTTSLGKKEILSITQTVKATLNEMNTLYVEGGKYIVGDKEYLDMIKQIKDNNWTRAFGEVILDEFTNLVLARNVEQIRLRSEVTHALTLLMNAILNVCEMSMEES